MKKSGKGFIKNTYQDIALKLEGIKTTHHGITYMETSLGIFLIVVIIFAVLMLRAVKTGGQLGRTESILSLLCLLGSIAGFSITLYGHFIVRNEGRINWLWGLCLNGAMLLFLSFIFGIGLKV